MTDIYNNIAEEETATAFTWVTDNASLVAALSHIHNKVVYIDTEFVRRTTYWPQAALIQIRVDGKNFLIDPIGISNWQPLSELLTHQKIVKVLHAASEDIQLLWKLTKSFPNSIFDTQSAHALLSEELSIGYSKLVQTLLDITIKTNQKTQTSNWLKRPLTETQCHYAVQDIIYLELIYAQQQSQLASFQGRSEWHRQLCQQQLKLVIDNCLSDGRLSYLSVQGVGSIQSSTALARLQQYTQWREQEARRRDVVRSYLIPDKTLIEIANIPLENLSQSQKAGFGRQFHYQQDLLALHQCLEGVENRAPLEQPQILPRSKKNLYMTMIAKKKHIAQQLGISHQLLATKKNIQEFILSKGQCSFGQWQDQLLQQPLGAILQETV